MSVVKIERPVLEKNDRIAQQNRALFGAQQLFVLNLVSSPGAGKTSLLEQTIDRLRGRLRVGVIEGDVQTDLDAQRVARYGVPVVQIVTNGGCHLEARLVQEALGQLDLSQIDLLVIENVGNLVCPANFDLGEAMKIVVISTTEGDDKPLKYPAMFRESSVVVINKTDLLPYVSCDMGTLAWNAVSVNPALRIFETSCTTGAGLADWCDWLAQEVERRRA
jgi:hydrogenase nickel incorporation protein HypB